MNNWSTLVGYASEVANWPTISKDAARPVGRYTRIDAKKRDEILEGYRSGIPVAELAKTYGAHRSTISNIVKRAGLTDPDRKKRFTPDVEQAIVQAYQAGATSHRLAEEHGCSHSTVTEILKRHGTARRGRHSKNK